MVIVIDIVITPGLAGTKLLYLQYDISIPDISHIHCKTRQREKEKSIYYLLSRLCDLVAPLVVILCITLKILIFSI